MSTSIHDQSTPAPKILTVQSASKTPTETSKRPPPLILTEIGKTPIPAMSTSIHDQSTPAPTILPVRSASKTPTEHQKRPPPLNLTEIHVGQMPTGAVSTSPLFTFRGSTTTATTPRTPSSEPTVNLLNAINLNLEKVVRRQIEFEHTVIRKLDTANKRVSGVESSLNTILERLDVVKATREGPSTTEAVLTDEMFSDVPSNQARRHVFESSPAEDRASAKGTSGGEYERGCPLS